MEDIFGKDQLTTTEGIPWCDTQGYVANECQLEFERKLIKDEWTPKDMGWQLEQAVQVVPVEMAIVPAACS